MPFFQISLFDKSRGITYTSSTFGTYKEAVGAYDEFIASDFMTEFFDLSISKITEKDSYTTTPPDMSARPLEGMFYESLTSTRFRLHIMNVEQHDLVEQVMTTFGIPVVYEHSSAYFKIPYLHTIQRLGAEDIVTTSPDQFNDICVVGKNPGHIKFEDDDADYVPPEGESDGSDEYTDDNLEGFFYQKYGKGYLLTWSADHESFGEPYFMEGWWNDNAQGWFFKAEFKNVLKERGAIRIKRDSSARKRLDFSDDSAGTSTSTAVDESLEGMVFFTYGRGFMLKAPKNDSRWGTKYFHGGWWNTKAQGWFFKSGSDTVSRLTDLGAKHLTSKKSSSR